jgi:hypothetical protein
MTPTVSTQFALDRGERQLWAGAPKQGLVLRPTDAFQIPFSLLWGGFAVFWMASAIRMNAPPFFVLFGVPFVLIGVYMFAGRFITDAWRRRNTTYAVTTDRVIIESGLRTLTLTSLDLKTLPEVTLHERRDGWGTITFGPPLMSGMIRAGGWPGTQGPPALELIPDARRVYDIIREAQKERAGA